MTSYSELSLDYLTVLTNTTSRSFFLHPPDRPDARCSGRVKLQTHLEDQISLDPEMDKGMVIDTSVENFSGAVPKSLATSNPKCCPRYNPRPLIQGGIQMRYAWRTVCVGGGRSQGTLLWKPRSTAIDPPAQRVEERPAVCDARIPRSRRPIAVEDDQKVEEISYTV
jgi:hypothetical protein